MVTAAQARTLLARHGETRTQPARAWTGEVPLPPALASFYREVGPVDVQIHGPGDAYLLPSLTHVWELQAGYRWDGITSLRLRSWKDDWLVVAVEGPAPFILSRASGRVSLAHHGPDGWTCADLFADLNQMAACLATLGSIVASAGQELAPESGPRPAQVHQALTDLAPLLGCSTRAHLVLTALGWR